jgi:hypothetical protein
LIAFQREGIILEVSLAITSIASIAVISALIVQQRSWNGLTGKEAHQRLSPSLSGRKNSATGMLAAKHNA